MKIFSLRKGFTLVELMVVIAIIAILTAIITTNFAQAKAKARDAKRVSDLAQIQLALELYFDRCNSYPFTLDLTQNSGCPSGITFGTFIGKVPSDQPTNYVYAVNRPSGDPSAVSDYVLHGVLETKSSSLVDAYNTNVSGYYDNKTNPSSPISVTCAVDMATPVYNYCVVPK